MTPIASERVASEQGGRPMTRRAESPRPIPHTRALAEHLVQGREQRAGHRPVAGAGIRHHGAHLHPAGGREDLGEDDEGLLPQDVRVEGPSVAEAQGSRPAGRGRPSATRAGRSGERCRIPCSQSVLAEGNGTCWGQAVGADAATDPCAGNGRETGRVPAPAPAHPASLARPSPSPGSSGLRAVRLGRRPGRRPAFEEAVDRPGRPRPPVQLLGLDADDGEGSARSSPGPAAPVSPPGGGSGARRARLPRVMFGCPSRRSASASRARSASARARTWFTGNRRSASSQT